jgi:hypothetical protein
MVAEWHSLTALTALYLEVNSWFIALPRWDVSSVTMKTINESHKFIHLVVCLMAGPKPLLKRSLHILQSRASSIKCEHPVLSLRSSSSFQRLLPRLSVTSIPPFIFPSITCSRRQFLRRMWPIQLAFRFHISCRIFTRNLWNTRREIQTQTELDQPPWKNEKRQTSETRTWL